MAMMPDSEYYEGGVGGEPPGILTYVNGQWVWTNKPNAPGSPGSGAPGPKPTPDPPLGPPEDLMTPPPGGKNLFNIQDWLRDVLGLGLAGGAAFAGRGAPAGQKGLEDILGIAKGRVDASEPLFKALMAMAGGGLPNYAREAGGFTGGSTLPPGAIPKPILPPVVG